MKTLMIAFLTILPFKLDNNSLQHALPLIHQKTIQRVLKSEGIFLKKCYNEKVITTPLNNKQTIIVIPEIKEGSEEEGYFIINGRIVVVNTKTGKVTSRYFEEEAWESDAVFIENIQIAKTKESFSNKYSSFCVFFLQKKHVST